MAVAELVSLEEYLRTSYRPDCDYVDGELRERNVGELSHGRLQLRIGTWMYSREARWRIKVVTEVRLQIRSRRFRIPDLMVLSSDAPCEEVVHTPPLLCIEILSKDDRMTEIMERVEDYFQMGVPTCWIIDPVRRHGWVATPEHLSRATVEVLCAGEIEMPLAEVFE